jgi:hypothetical protein
MSIKFASLIFLISITLSGCSLFQVKPDVLPPEVVVRNHAVLVSLPDDFFKVPDNIEPLDVSTASQKEVAIWLVNNEKRTQELENKIMAFRNSYISVYELLQEALGKENVILIDPSKSNEVNKSSIKDGVSKSSEVPLDDETKTVSDKIKKVVKTPTEIKDTRPPL